jgi:hypothetical protein
VWIDGTPLVFNTVDPRAETFSSIPEMKLRQPGTSWVTLWVPVHGTGPVNFSSCASFDANATAKVAAATPFKRPENAQYQPASHFETFAFDETGDTDARSGNVPALAARGAWGSIFLVRFPSGSPHGTIDIKVVGDANHASFDNLAFADKETLLAAEDRGDTLHDQLGLLDSVWAFDVVDHDFGPRRLLALGRDALAAPDGAEDNEPTGLFISDGSTSARDVLGTRDPSKDGRRERHDHRQPWFDRDDRDRDRVRWFVTEQHGMNQVFEILRTPR